MLIAKNTVLPRPSSFHREKQDLPAPLFSHVTEWAGGATSSSFIEFNEAAPILELFLNHVLIKILE